MGTINAYPIRSLPTYDKAERCFPILVVEYEPIWSSPGLQFSSDDSHRLQLGPDGPRVNKYTARRIETLNNTQLPARSWRCSVRIALPRLCEDLECFLALSIKIREGSKMMLWHTIPHDDRRLQPIVGDSRMIESDLLPRPLAAPISNRKPIIPATR